MIVVGSMLHDYTTAAVAAAGVCDAPAVHEVLA